MVESDVGVNQEKAMNWIEARSLYCDVINNSFFTNRYNVNSKGDSVNEYKYKNVNLNGFGLEANFL
jgi:hypothetical protein